MPRGSTLVVPLAHPPRRPTFTATTAPAQRRPSTAQAQRAECRTGLHPTCPSRANPLRRPLFSTHRAHRAECRTGLHFHCPSRADTPSSALPLRDATRRPNAARDYTVTVRLAQRLPSSAAPFGPDRDRVERVVAPQEAPFGRPANSNLNHGPVPTTQHSKLPFESPHYTTKPKTRRNVRKIDIQVQIFFSSKSPSKQYPLIHNDLRPTPSPLHLPSHLPPTALHLTSRFPAGKQCRVSGLEFQEFGVWRCWEGPGRGWGRGR